MQYPWHLIRLLLELTAIYGPYLGERWLVILIVVVEVVYILSITHRKKNLQSRDGPNHSAKLSAVTLNVKAVPLVQIRTCLSIYLKDC